ncbi:MAG: class I SAM-dependent methyltransferase [Candidatus Heimdallarchaeota archaeon]|nr:class I SAM-dependent methyltransferase [Candidatus Heimdallarchaeota archaeon]
MISSKLFERYYPDNFRDGTHLFYNWLRSCIQTDFAVINIGAGQSSDNKIKSLRGEVRKVVGVDIDQEVMNNTDLDEAIVIKNNRLPFSDNTFNLAWSDSVLEHIEKPEIFLKEICRVLKPKASFFFRTPNKFHYVSLIANVTPHWFHKLIANKVRGLSNEAHEPYPTYHRLNSKKTITKHSRSAGFREIDLRYVEAEPSYLVFHAVPFLFGVLYERIVNGTDRFSGIRANFFGRLEK